MRRLWSNIVSLHKGHTYKIALAHNITEQYRNRFCSDPLGVTVLGPLVQLRQTLLSNSHHKDPVMGDQ